MRYAGEGLDCFGYDDHMSKNHDFGTGVCLWVMQEDLEKFGRSLAVAYDEMAEGQWTALRKGVYSMSQFTEADLEYDYIYKAKKNMEFIERQCNGETESDEDFSEMPETFEITQLMNSFFGLLMIPSEGYFEKLSKDFADDAQSRGIYEKLKWDHAKYSNTFLQKENQKILYKSEETSAKTLLRRLRSAVAHAGFRPYPEYVTETVLVEGYEFTDHSTIYGLFGSDAIKSCRAETPGAQTYEQNFRLVLSMDEIRMLFFDFCDLILSHYEDEEE